MKKKLKLSRKTQIKIIKPITMAQELISEQVWSRLTAAVKKSRGKSIVAVAYFGQGGAKMLPLKKGSALVVDASEKAVKSGQTHPNDLLELYNRGVYIYSKENLHAKIFVTGHSLYVGSTNVSKRSAGHLKEVLFRTGDTRSIKNAKVFINSMCTIEMGKEQLMRLQKIYKPPKISGSEGNHLLKKSKIVDDSSRFFIYQLMREDYKLDEQKQFDIGKKEAEAKRIIKSRHIVDQFVWYGNFLAKKYDHVVLVTDEGGKELVSPPGTIIHFKRWKQGSKKKVICFIEIPTKRRKNMSQVKKHLDSKGKKRIKKNGKTSWEFGREIESLWK
jgi:hypothetical protein